MILLKTNITRNYSKPSPVKNFYKGQKRNKTIKERIISDTRNFLEQEGQEENVDKFYSDNFIIYKSRGDKNKTLSNKEDISKFKPYLKDITNGPKIKYHTWKIQ